MYNYSSNSNKKKTENEKKKEKLKPVVHKKVSVKKKNKLWQFAERFLPQDETSIVDHIIDEYIIPSIGNTLMDTIGYIFNLNRKSSKRNVSGSSYRDYYEKGRDSEPRESRRDNSVYAYNDIIFDYRPDAEDVLDELGRALDEYGVVSVADLYDLADISNNNYAANDYGWTSLARAEIIRARGGGYKIKFPRAMPID